MGVPRDRRTERYAHIVDSVNDVSKPGAPIKLDHVVLPPAGRAEFIVEAPPASVGLAQLVTQKINTGFIRANDPARPLATIQPVDGSVLQYAAQVAERLPAFTGEDASHQRFAGLAQAGRIGTAIRSTLIPASSCGWISAGRTWVISCSIATSSAMKIWA